MTEHTPVGGQETPAPRPTQTDDVAGAGAMPPVDPAAPVVDTGAETAAPPTAASEDPQDVARRELAERTADLQRLQAEYVNYKRRVDRDRELVRQNAVFTVLAPMLDVLDSIDRAKEAGALEGGFKEVAEQLDRVVAGLGLVRFGEPGDPFDPTLHDALSHVGTDPEVRVVTCKHVVKTGYRIGDRVMRPAQVLVVDPADPTPTTSAEAPAAEPSAAGVNDTGANETGVNEN